MRRLMDCLKRISEYASLDWMQFMSREDQGTGINNGYIRLISPEGPCENCGRPTFEHSEFDGRCPRTIHGYFMRAVA